MFSKKYILKYLITGKLEIPGIADTTILNVVKTHLIDVLQPHIENDLTFKLNNNDKNNEDDSGVLINSGFNCNYQIDREKVLHLLKSDKFQIETVYEPCSYPGVICKYYY